MPPDPEITPPMPETTANKAKNSSPKLSLAKMSTALSSSTGMILPSTYLKLNPVTKPMRSTNPMMEMTMSMIWKCLSISKNKDYYTQPSVNKLVNFVKLEDFQL